MSLCTRRLALVVCFAFLLSPVGPNAASAQQVAVEAPAVASSGPIAAPRPLALVPLYASFAALQALDADSTLRAIGYGSRELNPVLSSVVSSPAGLLALKVGTTAAVVAATDHLRKHNPKTAVALMIGLNSALAMVAVHNYDVARRSR